MIFDTLCPSPKITFVRPGNGLWVSALSMVLACGCADNGHPPTYSAGGMVSLGDGTPLPGGWIELQLVSDGTAPTAKAAIQSDGRFELGTYAKADGALEGTHRVLIFPPFPRSSHPDSRQPPPQIDPKRYPRINPKYRSFDTSGLKLSVTSEPSGNRFEIRLEN